MPRSLFVALLLLLLFVGLLLTLPARVVVSQLPLAESGVYLQGVQGPWHRGSSEVIRVRTGNFYLDLEQAEWNLGFMPLLLGRVDVQLEALFTGKPLNGRISRRANGELAVENLNADTSVAALRAVLPPAPVEVNADLVLRDADIRLEDTWPAQLAGFVQLRELTVATPMSLIELGDVRLRMESQQPDLALVIDDYQGAYNLDGLFTLSPALQYSIDVSATPDASVSSEIHQQLSFAFGAPDNGRYRLAQGGVLGN